MIDIQVQRVGEILHELEEDTSYKALAETGNDLRFEQFRQDVRALRMRCFHANTTLDNVHRKLGPLQRDCFGTLAPFRPFLNRALATLDG